ncbi:phospholipase D family protein [Sutcliffiella rhizosphaerae]|uniref:Cardiolipin synthase A n=1 Tax=Sutcliffiella rhizosphaerae TaxID=2880967 RepID=A0ABN8ACH7_9BACI|nr:phospholipase D family protein [Sutcliffiella rhizosphaerae]CAG9621681.1 Cardiolipin synthase A [Sutcliffiella rhizosphaerae]
MVTFIKKHKIMAILTFLILLLVITSTYHSYKPLPAGVSYESGIHYVTNVDLLYDLTYGEEEKPIHEQEIFDRIYQIISEAEEFVVIDMFLFNDYHDGEEDYPTLSNTFVQHIINKKKLQPEVEIVFITDEVNTTYGSHESRGLNSLRESGVKVIETDVHKLRDSNPLYSGFWRVFFQWFGQEGKGWIQNPMAKNAPKVTVRSYLQLLNIKANHRKVVATDKSAIISSANPHDASGFHSNIAFEVSGPIIQDILNTEQAVLNFSGGGTLPKYKGEVEEGQIAVQLLTEGKIMKHVLQEINSTDSKDEIWLAMFYLAERKIIEELIAAAKRGVTINIILDPNEHAFGQKKIGLPNRPVAAELAENGEGNIEIRWYNTQGEQYHPKMIYIKRDGEAIFIGGSANFTRRNLYDLNLETNIKIISNKDEAIVDDMDQYFDRLWNNRDNTFTVPLEEYKDELTGVKKLLYRLQKLLRFTTY